MKIKKSILLIILSLIVLLTACGKKTDAEASESSEPAKDFPVKIGENVRLDQKPEKVVSLSPALTELIYELGYESQLAGVSDYCDKPEEAKNLPKCGSPQAVKFEEIEKIKPKLVVTSTPLIESELVKLQQMDIEVLTLPRAVDFKGLKVIYTDLARAMNGEIAGRQDGEAMYAKLENFLNDMESRTKAALASSNEKPTVIMLRMTDFIMATGDTFEQKLLEKLNLDNIAAKYGEWVYPKDKAADLTMKVIISDGSITIPMLEKNSVYQKTQAVVKDKVVNVDFTAFERQTLRMIDELQKVVDFIYPNASASSSESSAS